MTMRTTFSSLLVCCLLVWAPLPAMAQQTLFDFESPQEDQVGAYVTDPGAEISGGEAHLVPRQAPPWYDEAWPYRLVVTISNPGPALINHPVRVDLSAAPATLFDAARLDGGDLLPVLADLGTLISNKWVEELDFISRRGVLWLRLGQLDPGDTQVHVYFGNPAWNEPSTPEIFFSDPAGWTSMCVVSPLAAQADLVVESFVDNNTVGLVGGSGSSLLQTREATTIPASELEPASCVNATGAFYGTFAADDTDALMPMGLASTLFVSPAMRYDDELDVLSPFGDATVDVYDNGVLVTSQVVTATTPATIAANVADAHVLRVESDLPVLILHRATNAGTSNDAHALVEPALELFGANSGTSYLVATQTASVDVWYSGGTHETFTLDPDQVRTLSAAGTQGSGDAVHVISSAPVMAISQADGDGGETVTFLPRRELGRRHLVPRAAQYLLVSCPEPATTCRILDSGGSEVTSQTSNNYAPNYPNRLYFGAVAAGQELSCDQPVWAMFEDSATNTERNLWPIKLSRPRVAQEPLFSLGDLEPRYLSDSGEVITPTFLAPYAVDTWTAFLETALVPQGSSLRYQLSDDEGATWYFFDGDDWLAAGSNDQSSPAWQVHYAMGLFPAASGSLTVKAILKSDDGAVSPRLAELRVMYSQVLTARRFVFSPVSSPQVSGRPFQVTITAADDQGRRIGTYNGVASLQTLGGLTAPDRTPPFEAGQVTMEVAVGEVGPAVQLFAYEGAVSGSSTPFEVIAAEGAHLELVGGDQQWAMTSTWLEEPLVVRVTDSEGEPAGGVEVTFAVTQGGGALAPTSTSDASTTELAVVTDSFGEADIRWLLGQVPGRQTVQARLDGAEGSPVTFVARADPDPDSTYYTLRGEGGGCRCRSAGGANGSPAGTLLLSLAILLWLRRRGPRSGKTPR